MDRTVVALFDDVQTAQRALEELLSNGFDRNDVSVVRTNQGSASTSGTTADRDVSSASGAAAGVGIGAVLGGIAGLVVGLGVLAIPGLGPVIAAGPLATTLAGAGIGAAAGGIIGALTDIGIPEEQAGYYAEGIRRGGTLLTVRADENRVSQATSILNKYSPVDINQRASEWRSTGWSGYDANAGPYEAASSTRSGQYSGTTGSMGSTGQYTGTGSAMGAMPTSRFDDYDTDFRNDYQSRYANSGFDYSRYQPAYRYGWEARNKYQGRSWNDVQSDLQSDWQRNHPNDKWEDFKDSIRTGWERFKQGASDTASNVKQGARDTSYNAQRTTSDMGHDTQRTYDRTTSDMSRTFDTYDRDFRGDYDRSFRSTGYGYERYQPAYQYGYTLATDRRYRGRDWNAIESDARRDWETQHPSDRWEDFKDAVQHAWRRVKSDVRDAVD